MLPEKNPVNLDLIVPCWVFTLALLGGLVSYLKKIKAGKVWKVKDFLIELATAAFAGLIMFFLCQSLGIDQAGTAALTGISGHFSSRAIILFGKLMDKVIKKFGA